MTTIFDGTNWDNFELSFFIHALKHGQVGRHFVHTVPSNKFSPQTEKTESSDTSSSGEHSMWPLDRAGVLPTYINSRTKEAGGCYDEATRSLNQKEEQELFVCIMDSISPKVFKRISSEPQEGANFDRSRSDSKQRALLKCIKEVDYMLLWHVLRRTSENWVKDSERHVEVYKANTKTFSLAHGVLSMLNGDYVAESWRKNSDADDLKNDIVNTNSNLALVGALVLTFSFPMFVSMTTNSIDSSFLAVLYTFLTATCGALESVVVLLCIRNIIVINLVDSTNVDDFTQLAGDVLMLPTKINFIAVLTMFFALICFAFWQFYVSAVLMFVGVVLIPSFVLLVVSIARGIRYFHAIQPWERDATGSTEPTNKSSSAPHFESSNVRSALRFSPSFTRPKILAGFKG